MSKEKLKNDDFEGLYKEIEKAVATMEEGPLSFSESMKLHERTVKKISEAKKMLAKMESKIEEVSKDNS